MKYFLIIFIMLNSCEHFSTRDPELPDSGRSSFNTPTTPQVVLSNLENSFINQNPVNYLRCFQDDQFEGDLLFTPSQNIESIFPGFFSNWDLNNEQIYINNLFNSTIEGSTQLLSFQNEQIQQNPGNAQVQVDYYLNINHSDDESASEYQGTALFKMLASENDYWYITEWTDFSSSSSITNSWSNLKYNFGR